MKSKYQASGSASNLLAARERGGGELVDNTSSYTANDLITIDPSSSSGMSKTANDLNLTSTNNSRTSQTKKYNKSMVSKVSKIAGSSATPSMSGMSGMSGISKNSNNILINSNNNNNIINNMVDNDDDSNAKRTKKLSLSKRFASSTSQAVSSVKSGVSNVSAATYQSSASIGIKLFFLVSILLQNSGYTLVRRYDRAILLDEASDSSILITNEFMKLSVSLLMGLWTYFSPAAATSSSSSKLTSSSSSSTLNKNSNKSSSSANLELGETKSLTNYAIKLVRTAPKLFVPAVTYLLQGWVSFLAVARVDACTYTAITQCKLVTTAIAGYFFLKRRFSMIQVVSLIHLVCGVVIIVFVTFDAASRKRALRDAANEANDAAANAAGVETIRSDGVEWGATFLLGVVCASIETCLSGVNVVFVEKVFKDDKKDLSVWDRNVQLSVFSIAIWGYFFARDGYYTGWGSVTFIISCFGSVGGILIAFSVKYADSVLKTIAVSGSVVLTSLLSAVLLDGPYNTPLAAASVTVVVAVASYVTNGKLGDALKICS